jgi:hypothetical protein
MPIHVVKETIEQEAMTTDSEGNAWITKRINLQKGLMHNLIQVDFFEDAYMTVPLEPSRQNLEFVISAFPSIPTLMNLQEDAPVQTRRYPSAGDDSVLFKVIGDLSQNGRSVFTQFPSLQISSNNKEFFYSDHVYINMCIHGAASTTYNNIAYSFMLTFEDKSTSSLTHSLGVLAESHNAMCAELMSNGAMRTLATLQGNIFPMWRFGGIRPEHTISPDATNAYFLPINTRDAEAMSTTPQIRTAVADARSMSAYDAAFGDRRPDWLRIGLNAGVISGAVRDQWPPIKHADNGNVRML